MRSLLRFVQTLRWHWVWLSATLAAAQTNTNTTYFLVTEPPGREVKRDSYVLPLSRPEDIAHARDLILRGGAITNASGRVEANHPLIVARIAIGKDGINRNYRAPGCPEWSWHVIQ